MFSGNFTEAVPLVTQLRAAGFRGRFVTVDGSKDDQFLAGAGAASENAYVLCPCAPSDLAQPFSSAYAEAFAEPAGTYSLEAYDAATALLGAIDSGAADRASVVTYLRRLDRPAFSKRLRFSPAGEPESPPVHAYRVLGGRFVYVGPVG